MKRFTADEDQFIKDNFLKYPTKELARIMNRSSFGVSNRIRFLGCIIPEEIRQERIKKAHFKKGDVPHNKGKNMEEWLSPEVIDKIKKTSFQKGIVPHNTAKEDSLIRLRFHKKEKKSYKFIRIGLSKWVSLSRFTWEMKHGPLKEGEVIRFKDGDPMNCDIDNLIKVSRKENRLMNSWALTLTDEYVAWRITRDRKLMPELIKNKKLIEIKRQQIILTRLINQHETLRIRGQYQKNP